MSQQISYKEIIETQLPQDLYKNKNLESQALGSTLDKLQFDVDKLEREVNPLIAEDKGLEQWERFFKLPSSYSDSIEIRKARIIAELIQFMSDENVIRKDEMEIILSLFGEVEVVEYFSEYFFDIVLTNIKKLDLQEFLNILRKIKPSWLDYRIISQYTDTLGLETNFKKYEFPYNMCGTFLSGTRPYTKNEGISFKTNIQANTQNNVSQKQYLMTGTFKSGGDKI